MFVVVLPKRRLVMAEPIELKFSLNLKPGCGRCLLRLHQQNQSYRPGGYTRSITVAPQIRRKIVKTASDYTLDFTELLRATENCQTSVGLYIGLHSASSREFVFHVVMVCDLVLVQKWKENDKVVMWKLPGPTA